MMQLFIDLYVEIIDSAVSIAIAFEVGNLIVCTFMRVAFGGRLWFGR